ncbi:phage tail assembly chaperone [Rickettsiales endosymbiont of Stachyamoeba lipophora]|uniref:phage tail assembly chaperone n=1 Tax=Rickettsiales endosymbiont of Stachyamoeba lipophora TaxID=2486578 RepID=UPI000F649506|nr:phage tail assembly chaperone [Rickettsiales endosymbiont of Stachyamoeba lipophora]AZL15550.1 phage tail assembly chaperone [Rickettsiales endosymbiont of Stachyamoeba lipophora]
MKNYPWQDIFTIAFNNLNLKPQELWQLTPQELFLILNSKQISFQAPTKQELSELIKKFS